MPGRSEYGNTCRYVKGSPSTRAPVAAKSVSVSPGKPTITSAPSPSPGMAAARRSTRPRYMAAVYGRRMRRSTRSLPLCSGMCRCGAIRGEAVTTSSRSGVK
jgi:hypothetical protein